MRAVKGNLATPSVSENKESTRKVGEALAGFLQLF